GLPRVESASATALADCHHEDARYGTKISGAIGDVRRVAQSGAQTQDACVAEGPGLPVHRGGSQIDRSVEHVNALSCAQRFGKRSRDPAISTAVFRISRSPAGWRTDLLLVLSRYLRDERDTRRHGVLEHLSRHGVRGASRALGTPSSRRMHEAE